MKLVKVKKITITPLAESPVKNGSDLKDMLLLSTTGYGKLSLGSIKYISGNIKELV